jgi:hypothetical protein
MLTFPMIFYVFFFFSKSSGPEKKITLGKLFGDKNIPFSKFFAVIKIVCLVRDQLNIQNIDQPEIQKFIYPRRCFCVWVRGIVGAFLLLTFSLIFRVGYSQTAQQVWLIFLRQNKQGVENDICWRKKKMPAHINRTHFLEAALEPCANCLFGHLLLHNVLKLLSG